MNEPSVSEPFQLDVALRGTEGSHELLRELAGILLGQLPQSLAEMRQSIVTRDGPALKRQAHQLAGGLGLFGALPALAATRSLESIGQTGDWDQAPQSWSRLETEVERLRAALHQCLAPT